MANRESKKGEKAPQSAANTDFVEVHPNPHGGQTIDEAPIQADHPTSSDESTVASVIVQDPSTDSMFNLADPQTREVLTQDSDQDRPPRQQRQRHSGRRKTA